MIEFLLLSLRLKIHVLESVWLLIFLNYHIVMACTPSKYREKKICIYNHYAEVHSLQIKIQIIPFQANPMGDKKKLTCCANTNFEVSELYPWRMLIILAKKHRIFLHKVCNIMSTKKESNLGPNPILSSDNLMFRQQIG